jgi:fatty acid desaturase
MSSKYDLARSVDASLLRSHAEKSWLPSLFTVSLMYGGIWLTAYAASLWGPWAWPFALFIIAAFQNHFSILMHEAAHRLLMPSNLWNDRLGQALFGAPIVMNLKDYRYIHLKHHKYSGDLQQDPEVAFYHGAQIGYGVEEDRFKKNVINDLTGQSTIRSLIYLQKFIQERVKAGDIRAASGEDLLCTLLGWVVLLAPAFALGFGFHLLGLWGLAFLTITPLLIRWHGVGEHTGENAETEQEKTLTHDFPFIVDFFLYPLRSGWHLEHHLFPQIPWYQMKKLRRELRSPICHRSPARGMRSSGFHSVPIQRMPIRLSWVSSKQQVFSMN